MKNADNRFTKHQSRPDVGTFPRRTNGPSHLDSYTDSFFSRGRNFLALTLILLVLIAHGVTVAGGFVYDDRFIIVKNDYLKDPGQWHHFFTEGTWAGAGIRANTYRPLPLLSYGLNYLIGGLRALDYHLVNLSLHLIASFLLFRLAELLTMSPGAAWLAAVLFAIHPLQSEPVASVVGRMDLMAGVGFLGALLCHIVARKRESEGLPRFRWFMSALGLYGVALLSKEHTLVLPAVVLFYDWICGYLRSLRRVAVYLAYVLAAVVYLALRYNAFEGELLAGSVLFLDNPLAHVAWLERGVSALWVMGLYLKHIVLPFGLSPDYSYAEILPFESVASIGALATLAIAISALTVVVTLGTRSRRAAFALVLSGLTFLPVSNLLFPIGTIMGNRLLYLPLAGLGILVGLAWDRWANRLGRPLSFGVSLIVLTLIVLTVKQNTLWHDDFTLNRYAVHVAPRSVRILNNLGYDFLERGELDNAAQAFDRALSIYPRYYTPLAGMAKIALDKGNLDSALHYGRLALAIKPDAVDMLAFVGGVYRRKNELDEARRVWETLLTIDPNHAETISNLGILAWLKGEKTLAIRLWEKAINLPDVPPETWFNLALGYDRLGKPKEALAAYRRFLTYETTESEIRLRARNRVEILEKDVEGSELRR